LIYKKNRDDPGDPGLRAGLKTLIEMWNKEELTSLQDQN
jgi:hypothetical protein